MIVLALPVFLAAGWELRGWVIGATLWAASRAFAALLTHLRGGMGNLAGSGVVGFGMTFRALAVMVVVVALAATDARLALAVVLLYALAYTIELAVALALYFSGEAKAVKRLSALAARRSSSLLPQVALAVRRRTGDEEEFNPEHDFEIGEWIPIHLGPLDLSINKAVAYLILGSLVTMALGFLLMRVQVGSKNEVGRRQAVGEMVYEIAQTQVAEQGLPTKAIGRWFPYVASLMLFIWVDQHARLHPAAALGRDVHALRASSCRRSRSSPRPRARSASRSRSR